MKLIPASRSRRAIEGKAENVGRRAVLSVASRLIKDLLSNVVQAHLAAHGRQARNHHFAQVTLDVVSAIRLASGLI